jgi:hypothetical protein
MTCVEPKGGGSRISQTLEYAVKFGPVGWLLDALVMRRKLSAALDDVFARLARHAEARSTTDAQPREP